MRALLGTASHFCEVVVLKLRTVPIGTARKDLSMMAVLGWGALKSRGGGLHPRF